MKKLSIVIMLIMAAIFLVPELNEEVEASARIIEIDGAQVTNNRTLVPLRSVFEELNATVQWDQKQQTVTIVHKEANIVLRVNSKQVRVNGQLQTIDVAPVIHSGRTFVPLRFISETIGAAVSWDQKNSIATIKYDGKELRVKANFKPYKSFARDKSKTYHFSYYEGRGTLSFSETKNNRDYWRTTYTYTETHTGMIYYRENENGLYQGSQWSDNRYVESLELKYPAVKGASWVNYYPGYYTRSTITATNKTFRSLGEVYHNAVEVKVVDNYGGGYYSYFVEGMGEVGSIDLDGYCGEMCTILRSVQ
ncbi:copper amine oxidase N-terminal domain-containing protein [Alkalihalophilus marmarensis]|jgi:hypothetical protein|uniref:copper amine oxidase N-terminal domain-containing protein n=1 Tax=Alkalihalophilus marmarensis TaxID=521377 RepID=UPI002040AAC3|nr:copper amine oxidase N-terminal domain-containing protein [Alkalihalophilus marmarensis]MCM3489882.1 copper amine oxidase N-terminal domain-containing protein [Alkalihalophilus marmarensis]